MDHEASTPRIIKPRRKHSRAFKEQVLADCRHSGESVAAIALRHGINANLIHKWRRTRQRDTSDEFLRLPAPGGPMPPAATMPVTTGDTIRLEVAVGQSHITVHWPVSQMHQSVEWLKALTQ